jgi:hypothetical protein
MIQSQTQLQSDIGVQLSGVMYVICYKGTLLPYETEMMLKPASSEVELALYQGPHAYVSENKFIGSSQLINLSGAFTIKFIIDETIKVYIDEFLCEFIYDKADLGDPDERDSKNREKENARQEFVFYMNETIATLEMMRDKISPTVMERMVRSKGIVEIEDVSKEEFEMAQLEIENWLNPIMRQFNASF